MGSTPVVLHEEAIVEARAAREWYEARSTAAAQAFFAELDYAIEQIAELTATSIKNLQSKHGRQPIAKQVDKAARHDAPETLAISITVVVTATHERDSSFMPKSAIIAM